MFKRSYQLENFEKSIQKLDEVLSLKKDPIIRDSAIKRFEISFDLCWKLIKVYAKKEGLDCNSPRECFKIAFQIKLIDYDNNFLKMIEDRNLTTHIYDESIADDVYSRLSLYLNLFKKLLEKIKGDF
ncbi:MAG TPA: HI0074 family nucleotidyltransferase substrate-binding subunit [Caldisericia bacterium]|nr:HI0074 family nucleotidyltransferase substrate-binding subunit [Caldisericia bacterium]HQL66802.1 HI0074 family nucleotidyltransferase substrate-binding subunit [Caldisericia bacterium]